MAVCDFSFSKKAARELIQAGIKSAVFNAECFFGKPKVRLYGAYYLAQDGRHCIIDISNEVGEHIAQVFTGIMIDTVGENRFRVKRIEEPARSPLVRGKRLNREKKEIWPVFPSRL